MRSWADVLILIVRPALAEVVRRSSPPRSPRRPPTGRASGPAGGGIVAEFAVRLTPGMRKAVPLVKFGEIDVEAG